MDNATDNNCGKYQLLKMVMTGQRTGYCKQHRRDLGKCTHLCDKTQGNNSTPALLTKVVFFGCKKKKKIVESARVLLFP